MKLSVSTFLSFLPKYLSGIVEAFNWLDADWQVLSMCKLKFNLWSIWAANIFYLGDYLDILVPYFFIRICKIWYTLVLLNCLKFDRIKNHFIFIKPINTTISFLIQKQYSIHCFCSTRQSIIICQIKEMKKIYKWRTNSRKGYWRILGLQLIPVAHQARYF